MARDRTACAVRRASYLKGLTCLFAVDCFPRCYLILAGLRARNRWYVLLEVSSSVCVVDWVQEGCHNGTMIVGLGAQCAIVCPALLAVVAILANRILSARRIIRSVSW